MNPNVSFLLHGCQILQACLVVCRAAAEKGAEQEAERQLVVVKKLKAEVTRKEGMLKATQSELDKVTLHPPHHPLPPRLLHSFPVG